MQPSTEVVTKRLLARARLRHLQVFVAVADTASVQRAAAAIDITQPTASQALMDLEELLQRPLFLRHSRGMALTAAGAALLPLARRALALLAELATTAAGLEAGAQSVVRVAGIAAAASGLVGTVLADFAQAHPDVLVIFEEQSASRHAGLIAEEQVDCVLCRQPESLPAGWAFQALWPDRLVVVANARHPLARKKRVTLRDLAAARWLVAHSSTAPRRVFDAMFAEAAPQVYGVIPTSATIACALLLREPLLSLLPLSLVRQELDAGKLLEIAWQPPQPLAPIGLLAPEAGSNSGLERFTAFLRKHSLSLAA